MNGILLVVLAASAAIGTQPRAAVPQVPRYGTVSVAELRGVKVKKQHKPLPYTTPERRDLEYRNLFGTSCRRGEFVGDF